MLHLTFICFADACCHSQCAQNRPHPSLRSDSTTALEKQTENAIIFIQRCMLCYSGVAAQLYEQMQR